MVETRHCASRPRRDETRLWGSDSDLRRDFGVLRLKRDTKLYISCLSLSQGCGIKVGNRSRKFLVGVGTKVTFKILYAEARVVFLDMLKLVWDSYLLWSLQFLVNCSKL